jgi:hypothetical protein
MGVPACLYLVIPLQALLQLLLHLSQDQSWMKLHQCVPVEFWWVLGVGMRRSYHNKQDRSPSVLGLIIRSAQVGDLFLGGPIKERPYPYELCFNVP